MQQAGLHELGDSREYLSRALGLELLRSGYSHELIVNGHVAIEQCLATIPRVGSQYRDDLGIECRAVEAAQEYLSADRVDHNRCAPSPGELADSRHDILPLVVDDVIRAQHGPTECDGLLSARRRDDPAAVQLRELHGYVPDPARACVDDYGLARLNARSQV